MTEYVAPYKVEGFTGGSMPPGAIQELFANMLEITPAQRVPVVRTGYGTTRGATDSTCPAQPSPPVLSGVGSSGGRSPVASAFLKTLIKQQLESAKSLMATAKAINPVEKTVGQMEAAYDAAFESDVKAALPYPGQTLQGFTVLLFIFSYLSLAIVCTIMVNAMTLNPAKAAGTFVGFIVVGFMMIGLFRQLG
jgi:hypothetical protein